MLSPVQALLSFNPLIILLKIASLSDDLDFKERRVIMLIILFKLCFKTIILFSKLNLFSANKITEFKLKFRI